VKKMTTGKISAVLLVVGLIVGIAAGYLITLPQVTGLQSELNVAQDDLARAQQQLEDLLAKTAAPKLPEDAVKLSELVPMMGEHWARPQDLPLGPIYLVHDEEVIGVEFMFTQEMMQELTIPSPEGEETFLALGLPELKTYVDHVTVEFLPQGHPGFEEPHYDVHIYFITQEERQELVPHEH